MVSSPSPSSSPSPYPPPPLLPLPPPASFLSPKHNSFLPIPAESKPLSPPKKSQPFPWTHQETLALIQAYQEKWYSLKRGQLKAFQWEEVSVTVAARCGFDEPSKTATQCRHKIEKLRKRYRSELQKPNPNSWQYFEYMDQMERGPMPLNARPIAVVKSFPKIATSSNGNHSSTSFNHGSLYSNSADYYYNSSNRGDGDVSDDSDEEWTAGYGVGGGAMAKSKQKFMNNSARGSAKSGIRAMEKGSNGSSVRDVKMSRDTLNGKRKQYFDRDATDSDDDDDDSLDGLEEEKHGQTGEGKGSAGTELAAEIRGFAETFMRMENKKIEVMRETERCRMEMEKKRMDMILDAQRKIVDTIGRMFGSHKKAKVDQET